MMTAKELVEKHVLCNVTELVGTLAEGTGTFQHQFNVSQLANLAEQASELGRSVLDYESAAREEGFTSARVGELTIWFVPLDENPDAYWHSAWEACDAEGIEPHQLEVYEHHVVSDWLADKLIAYNERVDLDFAGLKVWARTTTGQAIYADEVITSIAVS